MADERTREALTLKFNAPVNPEILGSLDSVEAVLSVGPGARSIRILLEEDTKVVQALLEIEEKLDRECENMGRG